MYCYQCEQTAKGTGCSKMGVCGKTPETADLQDILIEITKGISVAAHKARNYSKKDPAIDRFVIEALFTTVTNVNFDPERICNLIKKGVYFRQQSRKIYEQACKENGVDPEAPAYAEKFNPGSTIQEMLATASAISIKKEIDDFGPAVAGLRELIIYGLKGSASYTHHAMLLGYEDDDIYAFFHEALQFISTEQAANANTLLEMVLKCGEVNLKVMQLLDKANTESYGHPEPTQVRVTPVKGKAILVSGHDLKDLHELLKQTQGKGVNVYTHGEMLPCLAYPELKKFPHLVGNYGGAWQDQQKEFNEFPGAILMTTNCIQKPKDSYKDRIFTSGLVAWPGVKHITDYDFTPVINAAIEYKGFESDAPEKNITIGFARNAVTSVAEKVIDAVNARKIKHFFLVGGCDGAKSGRNYYTEFAQAVPDDCLILTLACGKYRFNKLEFGDIDGIPRLLDVGQCNDAYSAIQIASALANAFGCGINDLPLTMILSWYEQKAVCILLSLLYLDVKNIKLGPSLPAFIAPEVLDLLAEKFNIAPISTVEEDMKEALNS